MNKLPTNDLQTHPTAVSFDHRNVFLFPSLPSETKRKNLIFKFDANASKLGFQFIDQDCLLRQKRSMDRDQFRIESLFRFLRKIER